MGSPQVSQALLYESGWGFSPTLAVANMLADSDAQASHGQLTTTFIPGAPFMTGFIVMSGTQTAGAATEFYVVSDES